MTALEKQKAEVLALAGMLRQVRERESCEGSLKSFLKCAWPTVEHGTPFVDGWHVDAICDHLEACASRRIRKLIINIPPRMSKSSILSVCFPAWVWIDKPHEKFLFTSYDLKLAKEDSRKCLDLISSAWYQQFWSNRFQISRKQATKERFVNDMSGHRLAVSVDAGTTGAGGSFVLLDDPNNVHEMSSDAYIESVIRYVDTTLASRMNDPKTGVQVLIQQRCNERDVTGHFLSKELDWDHLVIPMEFEERRKATSIGWTDPRTEPGELMCPGRMGPVEVSDLKRRLGPTEWSGQYQQHPSPGEGAKFMRHWWRFWNPAGVQTPPVRVKLAGAKMAEIAPVEIPVAFEQVVQGWDMNFKDGKDTDLVAGHAWGRVGANCFLLSRDSARYDFPKTIAAVRRMSEHFPCPEKLVEDKANGPAVLQTLRNEIPGLIPSSIQGGLDSLATSLTGYVEAGNVFFPNPDLFPWVWDLIEQFAVYPRGQHDDDVAAASHALRRLFDSVSNNAAPEFRVAPRPGEPRTAQHVMSDAEMESAIQPHWRRWISVAPGHPGAALGICQTPSGSLRIYRELDLSGADAAEAGRRIAKAWLPDILAAQRTIHQSARVSLDIYLERECFTPIEPIGCYAEMLEQGFAEFEPMEGSFTERETAKAFFRQAKAAIDMVEIEDSVRDRLRDLLRFAPEDFSEIDYDRDEAFRLARTDREAYQRYMAAVQGEVHGEYPKIKIAASCMQTIAMLGNVRREDDVVDPFLRALLIGVSVPDTLVAPKLREIVKNPGMNKWNTRGRGVGRNLRRAM